MRNDSKGRRPVRTPEAPNHPAVIEKEGSGSKRQTRARRARKGGRLLRHVAVEQERLRSLGGLAFGIAHDLNNILAALRLRVGILLKEPACMSAQERNLRAMDRILCDGSRLLSRLQNFDRAEDAVIGAVDLGETLRAAVEIAQSGLRLRAAETGVQVRIRCDDTPLPRVRGVSDEMRHMFVNLLINARDAMPRGGTVTVRTEVLQGDTVEVKLEDEGGGISAGDLPQIFDAFFTTKGNKGTGMGLAMARGLMDRIGGSITACNRAPKGACFTLRFARFGAATRRPPEVATVIPEVGSRKPRPANPAP